MSVACGADQASFLAECRGTDAPIDVVEANDVVFAKVAAGLDFDHLQRRLARVVQAMDFAKGDVGGLVFGEQEDLVPTRDLGRASDHHPVLGAVMVSLKAQRGPGLDGDALDLEPVAGFDAVVPAPGARHLAVQ